MVRAMKRDPPSSPTFHRASSRCYSSWSPDCRGAEVAAHLVVSHNTARTHVQNLLKAAHVHSTLALVAVAREAGVEAAEKKARGASGG